MKSTFLLVGVVGLLAVACSDEGETEPGTAAHASAASGDTSSPATTAGSGGQGGDDGAGGAGGAGGQGGAGGEGGAGEGGAGGGANACLDAGALDGLFAIDAADVCPVALYEAPDLVTEQYGVLPTWGRHGGLLVGAFPAPGGPIASIDLLRFSSPEGASGDLEVATTTVDVGIAGDVFAGAQVVDLPWSDASVFTYTGDDFATEGGLVVVEPRGLVDDLLLIGGLGVAAVPMGAAGRVVFTALGFLGGASSTPGFYAADPCEPEAVLCDGGPLGTWGDATGPVTADTDGNVFAIMTSFDGTQAARGWSADQVAAGADPGEGTPLFDLAGFGSPLAALAPRGGAPGLLVFQPADATTFAPVEPIAVRYAIEDGLVVARGAPERLLDLDDDEAPVSLTADDEGRLWVGVPAGAGTRFVVLNRAP